MVQASIPKKRKRNSSSSSSSNPAWHLAKFESKSSPSAITYDILEEMGVGLLDSEESSSSIASAFALPLTTSLGSDENSNETNYKNDSTKLCHPSAAISCRTVDINADNVNDNGCGGISFRESYDFRNVRDASTMHTAEHFHRTYAEEQLQKATTGLAQQKRVLLGAGAGVVGVGSGPLAEHISSSAVARTGRSPLATVVCNNSVDKTTNSKYSQEQQLQMLSSAMMNAGNGFVMDVTPQNQSLSPCLPSTSQAALRKQQQLLYHMQLQKQQQFNDYFVLSRRTAKDTASTSGTDHFSRLSDEMILQVFKWLPKKALLRCGQVSRRFYQCAADETLWTRLDMGGRCIRSGALGHILRRGVVILRLAQTQINQPIFEAHVLENDKHFMSKLQYLDLSMATIAKPTLKALLSRCRHLKKLSLEHVPVNDEICNEIADNTQLEALNLTMCLGLEAWSVRKMMESLSNLNSLNISWTNLSIDAITSLVTNVSSNLLRLNLSGCRKTMFDSHLSTLAKRCPQLLELDLSDCTALTGSSIGIICKFKMLEYVSLSRCYLIPATSYIELANSPSLAYLDVFGMLTDSAMEMLERTFPTIGINKFIHSSVARPTVGTRRTSIWGLRTRD